MYVEYLERLLTDIELRRQERRASKGEREEGRGEGERGEEEEAGEGIDYTVISGSPDNKQQFLEDQVNGMKQRQDKDEILL